MYNQAQKKEYLNFCRESNKTDESLDRIGGYFKLIEPIEKKYGTDVCSMPEEVLRKEIVSGKFAGTRRYYAIFSALRQYAAWCLERGADGASDAILNVEPAGLDEIRVKMIPNAVGLGRRLEEVYGKRAEGASASDVYRAFAWFAFARIPDSEAAILTVDQISPDFTVTCGGKSYAIDPLARDIVEDLSSADSFLVEGKNYDRLPRVDGKEILRGVSSIPTVEMLRSRLSGDFSRARAEHRTDASLTYPSIVLSSVMLSILHREEDGEDPAEAVFDDSSVEAGVTLESYEQWKLAFYR